MPLNHPQPSPCAPTQHREKRVLDRDTTPQRPPITPPRHAGKTAGQGKKRILTVT